MRVATIAAVAGTFSLVAALPTLGASAPAGAAPGASATSSASPSASPSVSPPPAPPPGPGTGSCWNLAYQDQHYLATGSQPVDCAGPHNAEVTAVIAVADPLFAPGPDSPAARGWLARTCMPRTRDYVWRATAKTRMQRTSYPDSRQAATGWIIPNPGAWSAGARWVACLGVNLNSLEQIAARSGSIAQSGPGPTLCVRRTSFAAAPCTLKKRKIYRTAGVVWIATSDGEAYPGRKSVLTRAKRGCSGLAKRTRGTWQAHWVRTSAGWAEGDKWAKCAIAWKR